MTIVDLTSLLTGASIGGSWTAGNCDTGLPSHPDTIDFSDPTNVDFTGKAIGTYVFNYYISNGACVDCESVTVEVESCVTGQCAVIDLSSMVGSNPFEITESGFSILNALLTFDIILDAPATAVSTVEISVDNPNIGGYDFLGTVVATFAIGESTKNVTLSLNIDDSSVPETGNVILSNPTGSISLCNNVVIPIIVQHQPCTRRGSQNNFGVPVTNVWEFTGVLVGGGVFGSSSLTTNFPSPVTLTLSPNGNTISPALATFNTSLENAISAALSTDPDVIFTSVTVNTIYNPPAGINTGNVEVTVTIGNVENTSVIRVLANQNGSGTSIDNNIALFCI